MPLEPGEHSLCLQTGDGVHTALDLTDEISITVATAGVEEGDEAAGEDRVWEGSVTGEVTRPGCSPTKVALEGVVNLSVGGDGEVTGTATERWGECSVAGTTVPAADNNYRIDGRKTEEAFELMVSGTGAREMTIPTTGTRATVTFDEGTAGYEATITYTLDCVTCE